MNKEYKLFISGLSRIYGTYDFETKKFVNKSNSEIARDLFYSDSQFSRLINQTASEGEYIRANKIISRYSENLSLKLKLEGEAPHSSILLSLFKNPMVWLMLIVSALISSFAGFRYGSFERKNLNEESERNIEMDHMLTWAFEMSEVKSYTNLNDLPEDCNYPCYRLQGKWELKNEYKLPVFGDKRGFHYLAKEVNMYARCMSENNNGGIDLEGFEYQKHEIWFDLEEQPIENFLVKSESSILKDDYKNKNFSEDPNFVLVAHVHTFFRNTFRVDATNIERQGKVIGRHIEYQDLSKLKVKLSSFSEAELENEINNVVNKRVEDFSKPIQCSEALLDQPSVYDIEEKDVMAFQCTMTTSRLPITYEKKYILIDQVIKNDCRPSKE